MSNSNNFGSFLMGFTVGALAGAIVSLLLAPQTGEETRQIIKDKAIELKEKSGVTFEETKKKAEEAYKDALAKAEELGNVTIEKVGEVAKATKSAVEETKAQGTESAKP
ncbi:MAG: YtxH domain-containing protein [Anaerolineaceae bacterium]